MTIDRIEPEFPLLPTELGALIPLAYDLWWSWNPEAQMLFAELDPDAWRRHRNPVALLRDATPDRLARLAADAGFRGRLTDATRALGQHLGASETWYARKAAETPAEGAEGDGTIAYFSMEYGLERCLRFYSGGLGVLSGDHTKTASDLGVPLVAVGLLYHRGYFRQQVDSEGRQQSRFPEQDLDRLPVLPVAGEGGAPLEVRFPLPEGELVAKVWTVAVGRVPLILLDSRHPDNTEPHRRLTDVLYTSDREERLLQELLLGVGGARALAALGIEPSVWHLNEGHSVFLQLERIRRILEDGVIGLDQALHRLRPTTVFTSHTPVEAGNERFDTALVRPHLVHWAGLFGVDTERLMTLGRGMPGAVRETPEEPSFDLTAFAIRTCSAMNGVSELNAQVIDAMWRRLLEAEPETPERVEAVTNGIHSPTWIGAEMRQLFQRAVGDDWSARLLDPEAWKAVEILDDGALWQAHQAQKERLLVTLRERLHDQLERRGESADRLQWAETAFDPGVLTLGFARRFATYKRAALVFHDRERLVRLLDHAERPVQLVFAGKAHPADTPGQDVLRAIVGHARAEELRHRVLFLEDYDMVLGALLTQGVDVWLNTPRRPFEASGTSGQKAAMNGVLNFSILDGWWPEGFDGENGWTIGEDRVIDDEAEQDAADAETLYTTLETEIVPAYYQRAADGLPRAWLARMKASMARLTPAFSAHRMLADYVMRCYRPAMRIR